MTLKAIHVFLVHFRHAPHRVVSISGALRAHPSSIAFRFIQRRILMSDPNWKNGDYYGKSFPLVGMQNAR